MEPELVDRMCIVTRVVKTDDELIRFALSPEGLVVPDLKRKLPGRGVWVSLDRKVLGDAIKRNLFSKGFGADAKAGAELLDLVAKQFRDLALQALSITRKAGLAVSGNMKVEEALQKGNVRMLLHASDGSVDGRQKLDRKASGNLIIFDQFASGDLDLAFGKSNVIHVAIANGGSTEKLLDYLSKIAQYEGLSVTGLGLQTVT
jgi:predicted RNA-binding protein YlxR (DUF448 family)